TARSRSSTRAGDTSDGPDGERALAVDDLAAGHGHADASGEALARERAVGRPALVARLADLPRGLKVEQADVGRRARRERGDVEPERGAAGGHALDERGEVELAADDQPRVERGERGLQTRDPHRCDL